MEAHVSRHHVWRCFLCVWLVGVRHILKDCQRSHAQPHPRETYYFIVHYFAHKLLCPTMREKYADTGKLGMDRTAADPKRSSYIVIPHGFLNNKLGLRLLVRECVLYLTNLIRPNLCGGGSPNRSRLTNYIYGATKDFAHASSLWPGTHHELFSIWGERDGDVSGAFLGGHNVWLVRVRHIPIAVGQRSHARPPNPCETHHSMLLYNYAHNFFSVQSRDG